MTGHWLPLGSSRVLSWAGKDWWATWPPMPSVRFAHGVSAIAIVASAAAHLSNHLAGLLGGDVHWGAMQRLRTAYRSPLLETALLACVGFQVISGVAFIWQPLR
jgi:hypothetical protein